MNREQVRRLNGYQISVVFWVQRNFRDDAHPETQANVRLDDVGVPGRQRNLRPQAGHRECFVQ